MRYNTASLNRLMIAGLVGLAFAGAAEAEETLQPLLPYEFQEAALQGFGDRQNSAPWSMQWWDDRLFVGTVRSWYCWSQAKIAQSVFFIQYPPTDPLFDCAADPRNLPLQAEIWRLSPPSGQWDMVYRSPNDVPIPRHDGFFTARNIGLRSMAVYTDPNGTQALYAGGTTVNLLWPPMPPPQLLRSTDGESFEPVPQDTGTVLGDLGQNSASFRSMEVYDGRLFVTNGQIQGAGKLLEARGDPASGNDSFEWISPPGARIFEMATYNGLLFLGAAGQNGYAVYVTDASGDPPYTYRPIITQGAFLTPSPSNSVVSMYVFRNRLYIGTNRPAELIRINPDFSWDLIIGKPRQTPFGMKRPLTGIGPGFDWPMNVHVWRMEEHEGTLYAASADDSYRWIRLAFMEPLMGPRHGFDMYATVDGYYFSPVSITGFGRQLQHGVRTMASTPHGLFVGAVNLANGLGIYLGRKGQGEDSMVPAQKVEVETFAGSALVSWDPSAEGARFHVWRDNAGAPTAGVLHATSEADFHDPVHLPGFSQFRKLGTTTETHWLDTTTSPMQRYHYIVMAEGPDGRMSGPSNLARYPSYNRPATYVEIYNMMMGWGAPAAVRQPLIDSYYASRGGDYATGLERIDSLLSLIRGPQYENEWRADDLELMLLRLRRRVVMAESGFVAPAAL